jgi:tRNA(Ile)-lysidine synthase
MMPDLLHRLRQSLDSTHLIPPGSRVLAAVSGGPDSMALAFLLHRLGHLSGIAHCDHGLRAASLEEAAMVERQAQAWGVAYHGIQFDPAALQVAGESLHARAHAARYAFFQTLLDTGAFSHCATAHHRDDQAETILLQLLRGNAPRPLMPIPVQRGQFVRPLLDFEKAELLDFCNAEGLDYVIDPSNADLNYLRNQIRHVALPVLAELNPAIGDRLCALGALAAQEAAWEARWWDLLVPLVLQTRTDGVCFSPAALAEIPWAPPLEMALAAWLVRAGWHGHALAQAIALVHAHVGAHIDMAGMALMRVHDGYLLSSTADDELFQPLVVAALPWHGRVGDWEVDLDFKATWQLPAQEDQGLVFYFDAGHLQLPLTLRPWCIGDKMRPLGMRGTKKLSDMFIDAHWSRADKRRALLLCDAEGQVLAVSGFRISHHVRIRPDTASICCMRLVPALKTLSHAAEDAQAFQLE